MSGKRPAGSDHKEAHESLSLLLKVRLYRVKRGTAQGDPIDSNARVQRLAGMSLAVKAISKLAIL
jgi:hypothetical protein